MSDGARNLSESKTLIRLDTGLFPNIKADAGARLAFHDDGTRCVVNANGEVVYLNGPDTAAEAHRLGLKVGMLVLVRQQPEARWMTGPAPREVLPGLTEIPAELRGRKATIVQLGGTYKYSQTARVKPHRRTPGEIRTTIEIPMIWLEPVDQIIDIVDRIATCLPSK